MDTVIEGRVWYNDHLEQCCIGIKDGRIAAIKKTLRGERTYDFNDKIILPGAIDAHVHFRDPGHPNKEDFGTGSLAAACGGVTCVFDMPNTNPATTTLDLLREKKDIASRRSYVDFGLFAGISPHNDMKAMAREAIGFKMFMGSSTQSILVTEDADLKRIMADISDSGKVLSVHAEDERLIQKRPEHDLVEHASNRPPQAEAEAIGRLAQLAGNARVNICHVSSELGLNAIARTNFTGEVTAHHMLLDTYYEQARLGKVNPPLRSSADRNAIFNAFTNGKFKLLASDHAPHSLDDKGQEFNVVPSGVPGVETTIPLMLNLVRKGKLDLGVLVRCCAQNPGEMFGLRKGKIIIGNDADLMVIDSSARKKICGEELHSRCGWTPFEGWEGIFPEVVFLRGEELIKDGNIVGERKGRDVVGANDVPN
jgi:dihydroorotase